MACSRIPTHACHRSLNASISLGFCKELHNPRLTIHRSLNWRFEMRLPVFKLSLILVLTIGCVLIVTQDSAKAGHDPLDQELSARLNELGFTGRIESTLEQRLGRYLDQRRANLGRLLWFDTITGLNNDNTCAGCHSPTNALATPS